MLDLRRSALTVMGDSHLNQVGEAFTVPCDVVGLHLGWLLALLEVTRVGISNEIASLLLGLLVGVGAALGDPPLLLRCLHVVFFDSQFLVHLDNIERNVTVIVSSGFRKKIHKSSAVTTRLCRTYE